MIFTNEYVYNHRVEDNTIIANYSKIDLQAFANTAPSLHKQQLQTLSGGSKSPNRSQFVPIIQEVVRDMHAMNVVFITLIKMTYPQWILFASVDIRRLAVEERVYGIETGVGRLGS
ncbi:hypothetical protein NQZ79_g896 [Umbelopsis isabellina]|nr:hypothetical protein NQZ79_g896 [Umbelopsis isabellina]